MMTSVIWLIVACSGPGAQAQIHSNTSISIVLFLVSVGIALLSAVRLVATRNGAGKAVSTVVLAALHPGWWMSSYSGDCGTDRVAFSTLVTIACAVLLVLLLRNRERRPSERSGVREG